MMIKEKLINPVLEKEFRLRMRGFRSPLTIMLYLLAIGLLALGFTYITMQNSFYGGLNPERSQELFYFLSGVQLVLITFVTPGLTAGAISGEREKQTLNMLLTTQQSSFSIIMSKLFSSISFMILLVFATIPVYSIVFLYGGISPGQMIAVFAYFIFVMIVLGAFGIFFSTVFRRTVVAVITTYGVALFIYGFNGLLAIFIYSLFSQGFGTSPATGFILSLNPMAALISIFNTGFSQTFFGQNSNMQLWHIFVPFYTILAVLLVYISVRKLRPIAKRKKTKGA